MIRYLVEGQQVNLADDISITYCHYNPLMDAEENKGGYTYDFDIDLRDANNARIYKYIHRLNNEEKIKGRACELWVNNHLLISGTEEVLEVEDKTAKVQILCDNSVLNIEGSSVNIQDLELFTFPEIDGETVKVTADHAEKDYPEVNCQYNPVMVTLNKFPRLNDDADEEIGNKQILDSNGNISYVEGTDYIPQPYLLFAIDEVFRASGWTVIYNALLEDDFAKNMLIVHGLKAKELNKILPDWTVSEFIEEWQKLFNVVMVADNVNRKVSIYKLEDYYENIAEKIIIENKEILSDPEPLHKNFDEELNYAFNYDLISYDFPSGSYYNRVAIAQTVMDRITELEFDNATQFNSKVSSYRGKDYYNKPNLFHDKSNDTEWLLRNNCDLGNTEYYFQRVNEFTPAKGENYEEGESGTSFKIVPAQVYVMSLLGVSHWNYMGGAVIPYAETNDYEDGDEDETEETYGLNEWIEGSEPDDGKNSDDRIFVAQWMKNYHVLANSHSASAQANTLYPQVYTHRYIHGIIEGVYDAELESKYYPYILDALWSDETVEEKITFSLETRMETTYRDTSHVDDKVMYEISFLYRENLDPKAIYIIGGRKFCCRSLEYKIEKGSMTKYIKGQFFPYD